MIRAARTAVILLSAGTVACDAPLRGQLGGGAGSTHSSMSQDSLGAPAVAPEPPLTPRFLDRLRGAPELRRFDVGFGFTPPVPDPAAPGTVIVYAFMRQGLPPAAPKVLPPEFRIRAGWPSADVRAVDPVTPAALGLTLADGETLGDVVLPPPFDRPMAGDALATAVADFERVQTALLDESARGQLRGQMDCRRYLELLPVFATPPLIPVLRRASPVFAAAVDHCAAS